MEKKKEKKEFEDKIFGNGKHGEHKGKIMEVFDENTGKKLENQLEFEFEALYFRSKDPLNDYLNLLNQKKFHQFTYDDLVQYANLMFQLRPKEEAKTLAAILRERFFHKKKQDDFYEDIVVAELIKLCAKWIEENGKNRKPTPERKDFNQIFKKTDDLKIYLDGIKSLKNEDGDHIFNDDKSLNTKWRLNDVWIIVEKTKIHLNDEINKTTDLDWVHAFNKEYPGLNLTISSKKPNRSTPNEIVIEKIIKDIRDKIRNS